MIILDNPYASKELAEYLQETKIPVLKNDFSVSLSEQYNLNLKEDCEFGDMLNENGKLLTISEHSLEWVYKNLKDPEKINAIRLMKHKTAAREILKPLYPDFFFTEAKITDLRHLNFNALKKPFVLKPAVGFFSVGVYTIFNETSWENALNEIDRNFQQMKGGYPEDVIGNAEFILEEYITGEEYAIDAYYDESGKAVILNILKHEFGSATDVSDRLYYTSKEIIKSMLLPFSDFLNEANKFFRVKNFPLHIEVRVSGKKIVPIEFNPLRFAGWCTTDLSYFAYGIKTYDYFLNAKKPGWNELLKEKDSKIYSLILLNKAPGCDNSTLNYEALKNKFSKVLNLRKTEGSYPVFGFLFTETNSSDRAELDYIVRADLTEFLI